MSPMKTEPLRFGRSAGYCSCACPNCFDVAISSADDIVGQVLCGECKDAGCEAGIGDCCRENMDEDERDEQEDGAL